MTKTKPNNENYLSCAECKARPKDFYSTAASKV